MNIKKLNIWLKNTLHAISINTYPWSHGSWVCRWNSTTLSMLEKNQQIHKNKWGFCCCCCWFKLRCQASCNLCGPGTHYIPHTVCFPDPVAFAFEVPRSRCVLLLPAEALCKPERHINAHCPVNFPHFSTEESLKVQELGSEFTLSMDKWPCQFTLVSALPGDCVPSSQVPLDQSSILPKPWFITSEDKSSFPHSLPLEVESNSALLSFNPFWL